MQRTILSSAIAAAFLSCVALPASATVIDIDAVNNDIQSRKFIDSDDASESIIIKTDSDAQLFLKDLSEIKQATTGGGTANLNILLKALNQEYDGKAILVGTAGGHNYIDSYTNSFLTTFRSENKWVANIIGDAVSAAEKLAERTTPISDTAENGQPLKIIIGGSHNGKHTNPLLIGVTGGDTILNAGLLSNADSKSTQSSNTSRSTIITGNTSIEAESGNLILVTGGSMAVNVNGIMAYKNTSAESTSATLNGNTTLAFTGSTSSFGTVAGGTALAIGGSSNSTITGDTTISISTDVNPEGFEGIHIGVLGGGLSGSTINGGSKTVVNSKTTLNLKKGMSLGIFGGGSALAAEIDGPWNTFKNYIGKYSWFVSISDSNQHLGGKAESASRNIEINISDEFISAGTAGGGFAWANSGAATSNDIAVVNAENIVMNIGEKMTGLSAENKEKLHQGGAALIDKAMELYRSGLSLNSLTTENLESLKQTIAGVNVEGAHIGNVAGSIVMARATGGFTLNGSSSAEASSTIKSTEMNLQGGYNAFNLAGGLTIGMDNKGDADGKYLYAHSDITDSTVNISGGENIFVMGGGAAYATGKNGQTSGVEAKSSVTNVTMTATGGSVDGLYGGGLAIDDTNASASNAKANVETVSIKVAKGTINTANVDPILSFGQTGESSGAPSSRTYLREAAKLVDSDAGNAAILAGGMATGAGAEANVTKNAFVTLAGGTVNGNVYGGGAATLGGKVNVADGTIEVNGATVNGDIYAGGLAGSPDNNKFDNAKQYSEAVSNVEIAKILLASGMVTGDVHAGGYLYDAGSTSAKSTVGTAYITVADDVFQGKAIDGSGATTSNLALVNFVRSDDLTDAAIKDFDTISVAGITKNVTYAVSAKTQSVFTGDPTTFSTLTVDSGKTFTVGASGETGYAASLVGTGISGTVNVVNGAFGLANDDEAAVQAKKYAQTSGKAAALYVSGTIELGAGGIVNVGDASSTNAGINVTNGALIADAAGSTTVNTGVTTDADSVLKFVNVGINGAKEQTVTFNSAAVEKESVKLDNVLWTYELSNGTFTLTQKSDAELIALCSGLDVSRFYNSLTPDQGLRDRIDQALFKGAANLRGGMNLAAAAGVQTAAIQGAFTGIESAARRASLSENRLVGGSGVTGYAEATGNYLEAGGSSSFNEVKVELGGVVVGGEWSRDGFTAGALANVGTGSVRGQGGNSGVKNDVDYYGFNVYAGKRFGDFNVVGQAGYLHSTNDLTDSSIGYAKADGVDADAWTVGVRGETVFALSGNARVVPYVGLNYVRVSTDGYSVSNGVHVSSVDQNLVTVPVGIAFTGTMATASGWNWTPNADVSYVSVFGDRDVEATTTAGSAVGSVSMDVWNESAVRTRIGLEASKGAFALGVNAGMTLGSDDARGLSGQAYVRYAF